MSDQNNKVTKVGSQAVQVGELTGDPMMDDLLKQSMVQLEADRREADDLYEMIRQNAEQTPDDSNMAQVAVQALKVKQNVTGQATRILDITARYKLQRAKLVQQTDKGNKDEELLDILDDSDQVSDPPAEDKVESEGKENSV